MLRRKIETILENYKSKRSNKCLVVQGARQVGKTFSIREFGNKNYAEVLEINFKETPSAKDIFQEIWMLKACLPLCDSVILQNAFLQGKRLFFLMRFRNVPML